ncbi:STAS domain-containing protein [Pseudonocardia sp. WMMC193]|uniref:STAS domain-containing protein n=1 Tax=Pseudonocardia sp. WMMC193 TaxID=2911965 RepID=UPI001F1F8BF9|nr:STAS domain-containing protein [Pseudonocardia sp. WMMC193]MCF7553539.1 STAS domain-containing protein [Pseudonocardia sp. WMMC193]
MLLHEPTVQCTPTRDGRCAILSVRGEVDLATLPGFRRAVGPLLDAAPVLVVGLDEVGHLSAAGVRFLEEMRAVKEDRGGGLLLQCGEHRPARLVLQALGIPVITELPSHLRAGALVTPP